MSANDGRKEVVYQIPCQDCDSVYIEVTGRSLGKRITEHKYAVKTGDQKNGVVVHAWDEGHQVSDCSLGLENTSVVVEVTSFEPLQELLVTWELKVLQSN